MEAIDRKYGKIRVFLTSYFVFAILLIVEIVILFNAYNTLSYKGNKLRVQEVSSTGVVMSDHDRNELTMTVEIVTHINNFNKTHTIKYLSETIQYVYRYGSDSIYTFSDGSTYTDPFIKVIVNGITPDEPLDSVQREERGLADALTDYFQDYIPAGTFIGYAIFGLLFLLFAHGTFFYPESFWRVKTAFSVRGGEPTAFYIFMSKLSSVFLAILIYAGLLVIL